MTVNFCPIMGTQDVNKISMLGLAHIGDAVYELLVRTKLCIEGHTKVTQMHRLTVAMVNAPAQAEAASRLMPVFTADELAIYKRGRNTKVNSVPQKADIAQYHAATGLEAVFGWLYLQGRTERINELFSIITENSDGT